MSFSTSTKLALFTPEDIGKGEEIMGDNFLDLYPDPAHFVQYVKSLDRLDMASELFVRLLEVYHSVDTEQDTDPSRCAAATRLDTGLIPRQRLVVSSNDCSDADSALRRFVPH